ncbi:MAG: hypothetical protein NT045_01980, partial [Candidatus Aureabacteria bacterium]|nr:hypothetical protein [Candidatus Auribacterota bacterium]
FPILQPLWTNLYGGGSVLGLLLLSCFCAGECMNTLFRREASCMTPLWTGGLIASSLAAFALAFINPNTYRAVFYFMMSRDPIFRHIIEWRYFAREDLLSLHGVLLVLGAALLLRFWRDTDWTELMLFSVFGYLSIDAPRSLPFFAMATVPLVASRLTRILDDADGRPRVPVWLYPAGAFALCMLTIWYLAKDAGKFQSDYSFGLGVNMKLVPVRAVDFVEENGVRGPIFNSYGIGGYLIWRLYPRERVFLDGRVEMYGTEFLKGYMLYWQPEVWEEYVRRYGITVAIIDREPNYTTRYLDESDRWALVFFDDRAMIYLRRVPQNEALIRRYAYRYMRPGSMKFDYLDASLVDPAKTFALIGELQRSIGDEQYSLNSHLMLGYCYLKLGPVYYQRALKEYQAAAAIMPESRDVREKIAWLQQQLKV